MARPSKKIGDDGDDLAWDEDGDDALPPGPSHWAPAHLGMRQRMRAGPVHGRAHKRSVGYADMYTYYLPRQRLDPGIDKGYCLVSKANPYHGEAGEPQLEEGDDTNNARRSRIRISPEAEADAYERGCPAP